MATYYKRGYVALKSPDGKGSSLSGTTIYGKWGNTTAYTTYTAQMYGVYSGYSGAYAYFRMSGSSTQSSAAGVFKVTAITNSYVYSWLSTISAKTNTACHSSASTAWPSSVTTGTTSASYRITGTTDVLNRYFAPYINIYKDANIFCASTNYENFLISGASGGYLAYSSSTSSPFYTRSTYNPRSNGASVQTTLHTTSTAATTAYAQFGTKLSMSGFSGYNITSYKTSISIPAWPSATVYKTLSANVIYNYYVRAKYYSGRTTTSYALSSYTVNGAIISNSGYSVVATGITSATSLYLASPSQTSPSNMYFINTNADLTGYTNSTISGCLSTAPAYVKYNTVYFYKAIPHSFYPLINSFDAASPVHVVFNAPQWFYGQGGSSGNYKFCDFSANTMLTHSRYLMMYNPDTSVRNTITVWGTGATLTGNMRVPCGPSLYFSLSTTALTAINTSPYAVKFTRTLKIKDNNSTAHPLTAALLASSGFKTWAGVATESITDNNGVFHGFVSETSGHYAIAPSVTVQHISGYTLTMSPLGTARTDCGYAPSNFISASTVGNLSGLTYIMKYDEGTDTISINNTAANNSLCCYCPPYSLTGPFYYRLLQYFIDYLYYEGYVSENCDIDDVFADEVFDAWNCLPAEKITDAVNNLFNNRLYDFAGDDPDDATHLIESIVNGTDVEHTTHVPRMTRTGIGESDSYGDLVDIPNNEYREIFYPVYGKIMLTNTGDYGLDFADSTFSVRYTATGYFWKNTTRSYGDSASTIGNMDMSRMVGTYTYVIPTGQSCTIYFPLFEGFLPDGKYMNNDSWFDASYFFDRFVNTAVSMTFQISDSVNDYSYTYPTSAISSSNLSLQNINLKHFTVGSNSWDYEIDNFDFTDAYAEGMDYVAADGTSIVYDFGNFNVGSSLYSFGITVNVTNDSTAYIAVYTSSTMSSASLVAQGYGTAGGSITRTSSNSVTFYYTATDEDFEPYSGSCTVAAGQYKTENVELSHVDTESVFLAVCYTQATTLTYGSTMILVEGMINHPSLATEYYYGTDHLFEMSTMTTSEFSENGLMLAGEISPSTESDVESLTFTFSIPATLSAGNYPNLVVSLCLGQYDDSTWANSIVVVEWNPAGQTTSLRRGVGDTTATAGYYSSTGYYMLTIETTNSYLMDKIQFGDEDTENHLGIGIETA